MSSPREPYDDDLLDEDEPESRNPHASSTRWRHQESSSYAKYANQQPQRGHVARDADSRNDVGALADFLNSSRIEPPERTGSRPSTPRFKPVMAGAAESRATADGDNNVAAANLGSPRGPPPDGKEILVGPLLNYRRMENNQWIGSVLIVTRGGGKTQPLAPSLSLRRAAGSGGGGGAGQGKDAPGKATKGICLYSDPRCTFWRFDLAVDLRPVETKWEYALSGMRQASKTKPAINSFYVPAASESMRIMFHSCNGFSVGTDEQAWSGLALWNDVLRRHREVPFHVMIGGGDQIYNDGIRVKGPLNEWTKITNPKKRKEYPFPEKLREDCDEYYLKNYLRWYGTEPFATANGQIPQLNIWDDHDIIDGFGSYVNEFMKCDVFRGIGGLAHKYYMLFQHHLPPPPTTYTSDSVPAAPNEEGLGVDPNQLINTFVHPVMTESNYIVGSEPGPYVAEHSHNMFARLGARIAFLGIDARTERTRHQVNYPETYQQIFSRLRQELSTAAISGNPYQHLILLLGIPVAYPRLTWLENIFASPLMGPVKFLNRRVGLGGSFFNSFDGSVDLLDDLDDHYTARTHKKERNWLVEKLHGICAEFSIRITILGGDVHLAALGRFYSNPRLNIPVEKDYRYIANVVSSAIVNKPPPAAVANLLSRRNRIHHLNHETDETLLKLFDKDPGETTKTADHNKVTMPSRNYSIITENSPNNGRRNNRDANGAAGASVGGLLAPEPPAPPGSSAGLSIRSQRSMTNKLQKLTPPKDARLPISAGEVGCGTTHKAANPAEHGKGHDGGLDVCICVEVDQHDPQGRTQGYGLTIPTLSYKGPKPPSLAAPRGSLSTDGSIAPELRD
ncbi:hypothetical protein B0T26DRAFT_681386 [Lasiosphaeria miniovina]|uniref:PhoD-like phosphatase domain-containing protein n=1 Tax=Lasiosphaeria miniovina TaxID=1954250 RepID=A0AA40DJK0_9PEZI|nr:uncharacterized protein B0T26DRAFT_681386 [Lasiosphaeria miniovina]KAK0703746.1 hypothetical protein B0T26DRAFT_681386 [Lasiosphaeria miniovina]